MPDAPSSLGPFRLTARQATSAAGDVHAAVDAQGRSAAVVVLAAGAATDAAARDRFAAAVARAGREGNVLLDASGATRPWAALAAGTAAPTSVLESVLPGAASVPPTGPAFEPYWRDRPGTWQPQPSRPAAGPATAGGADGTSTAKWVAVAVAGAVVLLLAGFVGWRMILDEDGSRNEAQAPEETSVLPTEPAVPDSPVPDSPGPAPQEDQPEQDAQPRPDATAPPGSGDGQAPGGDGGQEGQEGQDGEDQPQPRRPLETTGPGVAGPSFTPDDETTVMTLPGLTFAFRAPTGWECERTEDVPEPVVRYACEDRTDPSEENPPGGVIEVAPCPQPCGPDAWTVLLARYAPLAAWRPVDAQTAVVEDRPADAPGRYRIRMSRIFSTEPGTAPDSHVYVEMTGEPQDVETLQKVVNDIRANTG